MKDRIKSFLLLFIPPFISTVVAALTPDEVVSHLATFTGVTLLTLPLTEIVKNWLSTSGWYTRFTAIIIATGLMFISQFIGLGFLEITWTIVIFKGALAGFTAMGVFTIEQAKLILALFVQGRKKEE